jgi:hypothetical protein
MPQVYRPQGAEFCSYLSILMLVHYTVLDGPTPAHTKGVAMKKTRKAAAPEATRGPGLGIDDDPTILAIVTDMVQREEAQGRQAPRKAGEPEVLRRAHPSLLLLDTPHRFI